MISGLKKNKKIFYKTTGLFIDWDQLNKLPDVDTFIDIGFGPTGTPDLLKKFNKSNKELILIDPLKESELFARQSLKKGTFTFYQCAIGSFNGLLKLNVEKNLGRSTFLKVTNINFEDKSIDNRTVNVFTLDSIMQQHAKESIKKKLNSQGNQRIGIKIDTEGYELEVIKGAKKTLKKTEFVLLEARHNHISFHNQYKLSQLMKLMSDNGFFLEMIITTKPFIADLCFIRLKKN
jgi:FkbM family methyltransferase